MRPLIAFLLLAAAATAEPAPGRELRGLWVVRTALVSTQEVDRVVDQAAAAGFNALFVQVRGRGDAFYRSRLVPRSPLLERQHPDFDPLARLLRRAHARGLDVHAWFNTLLTAHFTLPLPTGNVLARHPKWAMVPSAIARAALSAPEARLLGLIRAEGRRAGDVEGFYLSPARAEVHRHLEPIVRELVTRYDIDGLHLDFIRYPGPAYDYSWTALEGFRRHRNLGRGVDLLAGPRAQAGAWASYQRGLLTALAARLAKAAREERPGIVVSAAVVADEAQAVNHKFQAWPDWVASGILDAVCPMAYTEDAGLFTQQVKRARVRAGSAVWVGVGAYRLPVESTIERIRVARLAGVSGIVLFSHESFGPDDFARLRREAFSETLSRSLPATPLGSATAR